MQGIAPICGLTAFCCAVGSIPLLRRIALQDGVVDQPDAHRKFHRCAIPRIGGVGLVAAFYLPLLVAYIIALTPVSPSGRTIAIFIGAFIIFALGVLDDLRGLSATIKLAVQACVASWIAGAGVRFQLAPLGAGEPLQVALEIVATVLWLVLVTNAFNLLDGLDGLAGGVSAIILAVICSIAFATGHNAQLIVAATLMGAVLGFLVHNSHPATIFLGDSGSLFIGMFVAILCVQISNSPLVINHPLPLIGTGPIAVALLIGLPLTDTALAILRRLMTGKHLFSGDACHIHHCFSAYLGPQATVIMLYGVTLGFSGCSLSVFIWGEQAFWLAVITAASLTTSIGILCHHLRPRRSIAKSTPPPSSPSESEPTLCLVEGSAS